MNKGLALIEGLSILFLMEFLGEFVQRVLNLSLPGNLIGLLLLFISLVIGIIKAEWIEEAVELLLNNMMLLFIPLNVGLMNIFPLLRKEGLAIIISLLVSTILVIVVTGRTVQFVNRGKDEDCEYLSKLD